MGSKVMMPGSLEDCRNVGFVVLMPDSVLWAQFQ